MRDQIYVSLKIHTEANYPNSWLLYFCLVLKLLCSRSLCAEFKRNCVSMFSAFSVWTCILFSCFLERAKSLCSAPSLLSQGKLNAKQRAASSHASFILSRTPSPPLWPVNRPKRGHYTRWEGSAMQLGKKGDRVPWRKRRNPRGGFPHRCGLEQTPGEEEKTAGS